VNGTEYTGSSSERPSAKLPGGLFDSHHAPMAKSKWQRLLADHGFQTVGYTALAWCFLFALYILSLLFRMW
jgi:hypothetical protein